MTVITVTSNADQGSGTLRDAISKAESGDTIKFDSSLSNQKITLGSGLWLNKSLTFDGVDAPGLTVSGNKKTNIFWMGGVEQSLSLTVKNLTLADAYYAANAGGAIWAKENSTINIDNVNFTGNVSDGAALHAQEGSYITVNNSNFDQNDGASISDKEFSTGAISLFAFGELRVNDSKFTNNKGFNGGAIHITSSDLFVENSTFIGNDATPGKNRINFIPGAGGAIYADAASVPNDERFYGTLEGHVLEGESEGGIISINNSHFEKNRAAGQGGALTLWGYSQDKVIVTNNTIIDNEVIKNKDNMAQGGGVWLMGFGTVENNTISNNQSEDLGGGLFIWGEVPTTVTDTTFAGNKSAKGGAIYSDIWNGQLNINNVVFDSNSASEGEVLFTNKIRPVYLDNSQFINNSLSDNNVSLERNYANIVHGTNGADTIWGTEQNSYLFGLVGNDTLFGQGGNDYLDGGTKPDELHGGQGDDTLVGGGQNNTLFGNDGNDVFIGGDGQDLMEGGSGQDLFVIGDDNQIFYTDQDWYDHAIIRDFEPNQDLIQLKGQSGDYSVKAANSQGIKGAGIFYQDGMIALVGGMDQNTFSLDADYVVYGNFVPIVSEIEEPVVEAPTPEVEEPVLEAPAPEIEELVVEAPTPEVEEPVVEAPAPEVEEPVVEAPAPEIEEPVLEAPAPEIEEPVVEAPAPEIEEPVVEAPAPEIEEPVLEAPAPEIEEPVVEAPAPEIEEPVVEAPAPEAEEPVVEAPAPEVENDYQIIDNFNTPDNLSDPISAGLALSQDNLFSAQPTYNVADHNGIMIWHTNDIWHIEATGVRGNSNFAGRIVADKPIEDLSFHKLENSDQVDYAEDTNNVVDFDLLVGQRWTDGISFRASEETSVFLELENADEVSVKAGGEMQEINLIDN